MDFIVKTAPVALTAGQPVRFSVRPFRKAAPQAGDRAYLWFSETQGGRGLAGLGQFIEVGGDRPLDLEIQMEFVSEPGGLANGDLKPWRDATGTDVRIGIAAKIYRVAHHGVTPLTEDEAAYLESRLVTRLT